jgi:hypothetical protein
VTLVHPPTIGKIRSSPLTRDPGLANPGAVPPWTIFLQMLIHVGVIFCLENLNTAVDHPGTPFAKGADTLAIVAAVDNPQFDARHLPRADR